MNRVINVHDASIKTATVEIKSLTVSGRQVTMGVFRQLLNEDVIDPATATLRGIPWGTVNYFPKPCQDADHLHVVWQKGDELRRACVHRLPRRDRYYTPGERYSGSRFTGRAERLRELAQSQDRMVAVATINGWRPTEYRYASYVSADTRIDDDDDCKDLITHTEIGDDLIRIHVPVSPAQARLWQGLPEKYGPSPENRGDNATTPRFQRDESGELWVVWSEAQYDRIGTFSHYQDEAEAPRPSEAEGIQQAAVRMLLSFENETSEWLRASGRGTWAEDWEKAWSTAAEETKEAHREVIRWEREYERQYAAIANLDQLFIAV